MSDSDKTWKSFIVKHFLGSLGAGDNGELL